MKMHILSGGRLRVRKSIYMPDADRAELIDLPVNCYLLRHPEGNVLSLIHISEPTRPY